MIVPRMSPSTKLIKSEIDIIKTVQGSAPAMMLTTETPGLVIELPRLPRKALPMYWKYCFHSGPFGTMPYIALTFANISSGLRPPSWFNWASISSMAFPGISRTMKKDRLTTT